MSRPIFIQQRRRVTVPEFRRSFVWVDQPSSGFMFDSDSAGRIDESLMTELQLSSLKLCRAEMAKGTMEDEGVVDFSRDFIEPAIIQCRHCKDQVMLESGLDNECSCGAVYNGFGQELERDRSLWGEETGETYADIISGRDPESFGREYD